MSVLEQKLNNDLPVHCATETSKSFIESTLDFMQLLFPVCKLGQKSEIVNIIRAIYTSENKLWLK